jgi:copper transport protein
LWEVCRAGIIVSVSELRARLVAARDPATVAGLAGGLVVAGVLMACLLRPEAGRYVSEAIALVCAIGVAGIALFTASLPAGVDVTHVLRTPITRLAVAAFAAALVTIPFAVMDVSGEGLRGLGNGLARSAALRSGDYETVVTRGVGLVLAVGALRMPTSRRTRAQLAFGALLVVGSFLLTGHTRTHHPTAAVLMALLAHVAAAAAWFGGLLALGITLRHTRDDGVTSARLLAAFARTMTTVLALLLAAGIGLAVLYLPSPSALVRTAYGDVLLIKLAVVATTLVLSTANHIQLVPAAKSGNMAAVRVLRANIVAEQVLLASVLIITEVLTRQNPGG